MSPPERQGARRRRHANGALSGREIERRVERRELIIMFNLDAINPASYELTTAKDGLITPHGKRIEPGSSDFVPRKIILQPGEAALLSTLERLRMPVDVTGNITIRNKYASEGLTLLSGMLIDPGFGWEDELGRGLDQLGSRLYLNVANIGREPVEIKPGLDRIARVQFVTVCGDHDHGRTTVLRSLFSEQQRPALGFLMEMKELKDKVERTDTRSEQVMLFGFVVLAVSLIGVSLSTLLSLAQNTRLIEDIHRLEPSSTGGLVLAIVTLTVFGAFVWALGRLLTRKPLDLPLKVKLIARSLALAAAYAPERLKDSLEQQKHGREERKRAREVQPPT
jgi:deoxycytidine triphosphate deaminase